MTDKERIAQLEAKVAELEAKQVGQSTPRRHNWSPGLLSPHCYDCGVSPGYVGGCNPTTTDEQT